MKFLYYEYMNDYAEDMNESRQGKARQGLDRMGQKCTQERNKIMERGRIQINAMVMDFI